MLKSSVVFAIATHNSIWECDILLSSLLELGLLEAALLDSVLQTGVREELVIEPARSVCNPQIQSLEMVGAADHQYAVVRLQTVDSVEEGRSYAVGHEGIKVFKDKVAWCSLPGFAEDISERELGRDKATDFVLLRSVQCFERQFPTRCLEGRASSYSPC